LGLALALNEHSKSLILRRYVDDARKLAEQALDIIGTRDGYNGQHRLLRYGNRVIEFGGCNEESDKQRYKGEPHDLIVFDELPDFLQSQYEFIVGWNRTTKAGQRCRIVCTGNPPTEAEGLWVISRWAAWLDPTHPNPAKSGELRWYIRDADGKDVEVPGPGVYDAGPRKVKAKSRTFIRARLEDNPDLTATDDYAATLDAMPKAYRDAYRDGRFDASLKDDAFQVIPLSWIRAAQERWIPEPPRGIPQCAIGADVAQGGDDNTVLAIRHDGWYAPLTSVPGRETPDGASVAGRIVAVRRGGSTVVLDMGGGYGGAAYERLRENGIETFPYKGAEGTVSRTRDRKLGFTNVRSAAYWSFREALEPMADQPSPISLPNDPELVSDLTAPKFKIERSGISITPKDVLVKNLGRSPDKGDAVVMAWWKGARAMTHINEWRPDARVGGHRRSSKHPRVNLGSRRS
jgi:hypothetical protein